MQSNRRNSREISFMDEAYEFLKRFEYDLALPKFINLRNHKSYRQYKTDVEIAIARCYQGKKLYGEALQTLNALKPNPDHKREHQNIHLAYYYLFVAQLDYEKALTSLLKIKHTHPKLHLTWVNYYLKINDVENAEKKFQEFLDLRNHREFRAIFESGKYDREIQSYNTILYDHDNVDKNYEIVHDNHKLLTRIRHLNVLVRSLEDLQEMHDNNKIQYIEVALQEIINLAPQLDYTYLVKADFYTKTKGIEVGVAEYRKIIKNFPNYWNAYMKLGLLLILNENIEEGRQILKIVINAKDKDIAPSPAVLARTYNCLAITYLGGHESALAKENALAAIHADRLYSPAYSTLGKYYRSCGRERESKECFEEARRLDTVRFNRLHPLPKSSEEKVHSVPCTKPVVPDINKTIRPANGASSKVKATRVDSPKIENKAANPFELLNDPIILQKEKSQVRKDLKKIKKENAARKIRSKNNQFSTNAVVLPATSVVERKEKKLAAPETAITRSQPVLPGLDDYILPGIIGSSIKGAIRAGYSLFYPARNNISPKPSVLPTPKNTK